MLPGPVEAVIQTFVLDKVLGAVCGYIGQFGRESQDLAKDYGRTARREENL